LSRIPKQARSAKKKSLEHSSTHRLRARVGELDYRRARNEDFKSGSKVAAIRFYHANIRKHENTQNHLNN
jgi:hypothetical protein